MSKLTGNYGQQLSIKSEAEAKASGVTDTELWRKKIQAAKSDQHYVKWRDQAALAMAAYENGEIEGQVVTGANLFHANVETVVPSIYNTTPIPDIRVRHNERDKVAKNGADMLERVAEYDLDCCDFDFVMVDAVRKAYIVGEGLSRVRYEPKMKQRALLDGAGNPVPHPETGDPQFYDELHSDNVYPETVPWDRLIFGPSRSFERLPWLAFEHDMTYEEIADISGEEVADQISFGGEKSRLERVKSGRAEPSQEETGVFKTAKVYEIWDKRNRQVLWITDKEDEPVLASMNDPLKLENFFPIPKPLRPAYKADRMTPLVPYAVHKELFAEFERISKRINALAKQLRVIGLYDVKQAPEFQKLRDATDGEFYPAESADAFEGGQKRDLSSALLHWPIEVIAAVLEKLEAHREQVKQHIWEATGVADIMRGNSDPNETLGAQELKTEWGSMRVRKFQSETGRFARDLIRIMLEVRANMTPWEHLKEMAAMPFQPTDEDMQSAMQQVQQQAQTQAQANPMMAAPPSPQMLQMQAQQIAQQQAAQFEQSVQGIVQSPGRKIMIDIETDSTIRADVAKDLDQFNSLVTSTGTWAQAVIPAIQIMPETRIAWFELLGSQLGKFRLGKQGEDAIDKLIEAAAHPPVQENAAQGMSPEEMQENDKQRSHEKEMEGEKRQTVQIKGQMDIGKIQAKTQADAQHVEISAQQSQVDNQNADLQLQRDLILTKVQGEVGVQGEQVKQQGQAQADQRKQQGAERQAQLKQQQRPPMNGAY